MFQATMLPESQDKPAADRGVWSFAWAQATLVLVSHTWHETFER